MKKFFFVAQFTGFAVIVGLFVGVANGQGFGGGNTGGMGGGFSGGTGTGTLGGSSIPGSTAGRSSTGSSTGGSSSSLFNSGSSSSSSSLFGGSSSGSGSSGNSGSSGGSGTGNAQTTIQTGQLGSANPITRGAAIERNMGTNLIYSNADVIGGQATGNNNQFANLFSQIGRQMNQGGNFNQQGGRNSPRPTIRIPPKLVSAPQPVPVPQFTSRFESRLANLSAINTISPIHVAMEGSTAVLTGVVATEQDRQLAEGVASLEPEVETVRNEITVQAAAGAEGLNSPSKTP